MFELSDWKPSTKTTLRRWEKNVRSECVCCLASICCVRSFRRSSAFSSSTRRSWFSCRMSQALRNKCIILALSPENKLRVNVGERQTEGHRGCWKPLPRCEEWGLITSIKISLLNISACSKKSNMEKNARRQNYSCCQWIMTCVRPDYLYIRCTHINGYFSSVQLNIHLYSASTNVSNALP